MLISQTSRVAAHGRVFLQHLEAKLEPDTTVKRYKLKQDKIDWLEFDFPGNLVLLYSPVIVEILIRDTDGREGKLIVRGNSSACIDLTAGLSEVTAVKLEQVSEANKNLETEITVIHKPGLISWQD